jgi:hypothetical protein
MMKEIVPTTLDDTYIDSMPQWDTEQTFKSITGFEINTFLKLYRSGIIQIDNYELLTNMITTSGLTETINFFQRFSSKIFKTVNDKPKKSIIIRFFNFWRGLVVEDYIP